MEPSTLRIRHRPTPSLHLQPLIFGSVLLMGAFICLALSVIADLTRTNRILQEEALEQIKTMRFGAVPTHKH